MPLEDRIGIDPRVLTRGPLDRALLDQILPLSPRMRGLEAFDKLANLYAICLEILINGLNLAQRRHLRLRAVISGSVVWNVNEVDAKLFVIIDDHDGEQLGDVLVHLVKVEHQKM